MNIYPSYIKQSLFKKIMFDLMRTTFFESMQHTELIPKLTCSTDIVPFNYRVSAVELSDELTGNFGFVVMETLM